MAAFPPRDHQGHGNKVAQPRAQNKSFAIRTQALDPARWMHLMDDGFQMQTLGGDQRKARRKIEAHLVAEN
jgi:hypothetical protein